jgi:ABC-type uncharacterized transport system permease subunit
VWVPATVFGLCIFAFIALGFEISRRRLHLLKTLAIQCPLCFVAITGLLLSLSDKGSDKAIAGGVVFVGLASLIEAVSWGISRRVLRRLKG